ncbi:MAG: transglutaminase domain-containing protein [Anaerolineae bacterium]|nr:transglutaminase domain-containing protein [Anaerolineae bacterium]
MTERWLRALTYPQTLIWMLAASLALTVVGSIGDLVRGLNYQLLTIVSLGGLLLGWLLARIRAPWWLALLLIFGSGLQVVVILVGYLLPFIWAILKMMFIYGIILVWWGPTALPDAGPFISAWQDLLQGGRVVTTRLGTWLFSLGGQGSSDPLPLQLVWGWALWCATAWAAYLIWQRRQALVAVIPLGILLAITIFFSGINLSMLSVFLALALALQVVSSWERKQHRWQTNQIDWATDLAHDIAFAAGFLISLIVVFSSVIPQIPITRMIDKLSLQVQERFASSGQQVDSMAASFGIERRAPYPTRERPTGIPTGLPRRHLLGSGPELTEQLVMLVKTSDPLPTPPLPYVVVEDIGEPPPPYYWLAATFDKYSGRGWHSGPTTSIELKANEAQLNPIGPGRVLTQTVQPVDTFGQVLFTAGYPLQVDQPSQITYRSNTDWAGTILAADQTYIAQSWLPEPTEDELKAAGTDYPAWLTKRYLALPDTLPDRVRSLAVELTTTAPTPYDRAIAIERYLRAMPYSLDVPTPPHNQDVVDYFLFDLKKGYCDYYASSMVVLARAAGLPARLAIGYAPSPYDYSTFQYVVREAEAHSWAQIYFPDYGWIDFEPTGGRPPIVRSEEEEEFAALPTLPPGFDLNKTLAQQQNWWYTTPLWQLLLLVLAPLGGVALVGLLAVWGHDLRLGRLPVEQLIPLLQGRLERCARLLGLALPAGATPLEFETALVGHLERLTRQRAGLQKIIPAPDDIGRLVNAFIQLRYAPHPATTEIGDSCLKAWQRIRWRLWGTIVAKRVRRIKVT